MSFQEHKINIWEWENCIYFTLYLEMLGVLPLTTVDKCFFKQGNKQC